MPPQAMDCLGLALDWENDADVRARLREKGQLLEIPAGKLICKPTRHNANMNAVVLTPVLRRLNQSGLVLPHISDLKLEVGSLFQKTGLTTAGDKRRQTGLQGIHGDQTTGQLHQEAFEQT